ncbi:hypothetical protein BC835DRAFT_562466 [Cytidiella melzeri]|nr:hypothetical protein BC835DRAFT_562466 [Cytidiella melzeri]
MADQSITKSQLVAIALEGYLYGLYTVLAALTIWLLITRRRKDVTTAILFAQTLLMFGISTSHAVLIIDYNITIFLFHNAAVEGDVIPSVDPRYLAFIIMLLLNCIIGDLVVIWRVWAIWGRSKKAIAVPVLSWLASIVAFIGSGRDLASGGLSTGNGLELSPWVATFMGFTLLTNVTAVSAVSYRYLIHRKEVMATLGKGGTESNVAGILVLCIESGALYCITWAVVIAAYVKGSQSMDVLLFATVAQLTAIYPTLIVVLVCLKLTQRDHIDRFQHSTIHFASHPHHQHQHPTASGFSSGGMTTTTTTTGGTTIEIRLDEFAGRGSSGGGVRGRGRGRGRGGVVGIMGLEGEEEEVEEEEEVKVHESVSNSTVTTVVREEDKGEQEGY